MEHFALWICGRIERRHVDGRQVRDYMAIGGVAHGEVRRQVGAAPVVGEARCGRVEAHTVVGVGGGEVRDGARCEVEAHEVPVVWILSACRGVAVRVEEDAAGCLVDAMHLAHVPLALGELGNGAVLRVHHVEVAPAVAARYPEKARAVGEPPAAEVVDEYEFVGRLFGDGAHASGGGVHGRVAVQLVAAARVQESEERGVGRPAVEMELVLAAVVG